MIARFIPLLLLAACFLSGCGDSPSTASRENLAGQIGPIETTVVPYATDEGKRLQQVRFKFTNNGPKEIGEVSAKLQAYDASGKPTNDQVSSYVIFVSTKKSERLRAGQTHQTEEGHGFLLLNGIREGTPAVRVEASPTEAYTDSGIEQ